VPLPVFKPLFDGEREQRCEVDRKEVHLKNLTAILMSGKDTSKVDTTSIDDKVFIVLKMPRFQFGQTPLLFATLLRLLKHSV
jgi:hypothetical protein